MPTLLLILLALLIILLGLGYYFSRVIIYPKVYPVDETYRLSMENMGEMEAEYRSWQAEEFRIHSTYGYDLYAVYYPVSGSQKTLVLTHGITWSMYGMVKYARLFYKRGWNILLYDIRNHGRTGHQNTTFGFYEKYDLKAVVDWAFQRLGSGGMVATYGESLGAAITLQHAAIDPRIAFAVSDCAYSDIRSLFAYRIKVEYHLPPFPMIPLANLFTRLTTGMSFNQVSPIRDVAGVETPIFFIHGQADNYIPPQMSVDMYNAKQKGYRKLYLAPNAGHAQSLPVNPEEYEAKIEEFLTDLHL